MTEFDRVQAAAEAIRARAPGAAPKVGFVLGSGLGAFAESLGGVSVPYRDVPGFPPVGVAGHSGTLVLARGGAVLAGRAHFYEGHDIADIVRPVRTLIALGCRTIVLTNAAGGIRADLSPGDLVLLSDHISFLPAHPLRGANDERFGTRFPDMTTAYDLALRSIALGEAAALGLRLHQGVYACMPGPSYETPAEIRMLERAGAELVGMSTVPETIAAVHMGARVLGVSVVSNKAAGRSATPLSHAEVQAAADAARPALVALLGRLLEVLGG